MESRANVQLRLVGGGVMREGITEGEEVQTQLLVGKSRDFKVTDAGAQILLICVVSPPPLGAIKAPRALPTTPPVRCSLLAAITVPH